jgi:photosystem II stability/assembly factor-like uncharacterized protein
MDIGFRYVIGIIAVSGCTPAPVPGLGWTSQPVAANLRAVAGGPAGAFAVGHRMEGAEDVGVVLRAAGDAFVEEPGCAAADLYGVTAAGDGPVAVGLDREGNGLVLRRADGAWSHAATSDHRGNLAVWGDGRGQLQVAGVGVLRRSFNGGESWRERDDVASVLLGAVWASGDGEVWAAGYQATLLRSGDRGGTWAPVDGVAAGAGRIGGLWGQRPGLIAVGDGGRILRSGDGRRFEPVESPTKRNLNGVSGDGRGTVIAVGDAGTLLRSRDGGRTFAEEPSGTTADLHGVFLAGDGTVLVAGDGVFLRTLTN